jgi:hypothetical protein
MKVARKVVDNLTGRSPDAKSLLSLKVNRRHQMDELVMAISAEDSLGVHPNMQLRAYNSTSSRPKLNTGSSGQLTTLELVSNNPNFRKTTAHR